MNFHLVKVHVKIFWDHICIFYMYEKTSWFPFITFSLNAERQHKSQMVDKKTFRNNRSIPSYKFNSHLILNSDQIKQWTIYARVFPISYFSNILWYTWHNNSSEQLESSCVCARQYVKNEQKWNSKAHIQIIFSSNNEIISVS